MGEHLVIVYVKLNAKKFSITARMERARLPGVDKQMADEGFERIQIGQLLEEDWALTLRNVVKADLQSKGYEYVTREALS